MSDTWITGVRRLADAVHLQTDDAKESDFTKDPLDDRRRLRMYHFGPRDKFTIQAHVRLARQPDGPYKLSARTGNRHPPRWGEPRAVMGKGVRHPPAGESQSLPR